MKKRLISLLLAFSMMLTFLPAGAVSAFAEEPVDSSKGTLLTGGETIDLLARMRGGIDERRRAELTERFDLDETRRRGTRLPRREHVSFFADPAAARAAAVASARFSSSGWGVTAAAILLTVIAAAIAGAIGYARWKQTDAAFVAELRRRPGFATRTEVAKHLSARAVLLPSDHFRCRCIPVQV